MILCIGTTPAAQRVMTFGKVEFDAVNRARNTTDGIAGKSVNVAKVLAALGARPIAVGFAGGETGRELLRALSKRGIENHFVSVAAPTRQCISVVDELSGTVTELVEESRAVEIGDYEQLQASIEQLLPKCDAVVMSGSLTPGGPLDFYRTITLTANESRVLTVVDAQGPPLIQALTAQPGVVKPNRNELAATVGQTLASEAEVVWAMREVHRRGAARVIVTAGKAPTLALDGDQLWRIETPTIQAVNPIGSGDAFTAALVWRLVLKDSLGEACRWGTAAGAANALSALPGELEADVVKKLAERVTVTSL
jgi:tagatose 6-phosphate kinase